MANADTSASITYSITARSDDAIDTVLTKVQSFTKGNAGPGAKAVNLTASKYVIPYTVADTESTTITLTATAKNTSGSKIYKFYVDNTLITATGGTQTTTGNAVTCNIPDSLEPANGEQITVRVDVTSDGTIVATDSTSIYGVKDGSDAFTVILTNEAHVIPATSAGVPRTYANSGTDIRVFLGSTALAYDTSGPNTFNVTATSGNDIDPNASPTTVSTYTRRYGIASGMLNNASADFITYTIVARDGEETATTFTKIQSFTKGNDGVSFTGTAEYYKLTNSSSEPSRYSSGTTIDTGWSTTPQTPTSTNQYLWNFNRNSKSDSTFNDSPVTLVTQFVEDGRGIASIGEEYQRGTSATVAPTSTWSSTFSGAGAITSALPYMWNKTTITFTDNSTPQVVITLIAGRGTDGVSFTGTAEYYKLSNSSSAPTRYSSGTTIDTGWSTTPQTPTSTNQYLWNFNRNSKSDSTFNDSPVTLVTQFVEDGRGIASIGEEYQRGTSATVAPTSTWYSTFSGAGAITAALPYMWNKTTITFTDNSTPQVVITLIAARGADSTVPGPTGPDGLRSVQGYLYYEKSSSPSSAPAKPGTVTYNFSNGLISGTGIGTAVNTWTNEPRTHTATSANTHWAVRYYGTEASANASTISIPTGQISSAVKSTVFTGVVTFSGGTLTDGDSANDITPVEAADISASINNTTQTTTIDGGKLTTGSIDADRLSIGNSSNASASRLLLLEDSLKIFSGSTLRVHIGNLANTDNGT
jgi:hypothetical protein